MKVRQSDVLLGGLVVSRVCQEQQNQWKDVMHKALGFWIRVDRERIGCRFFFDNAPNTCNAIQKILPFKGELHYAKIAGEEVYFGVPLLIPLEKAIEVKGLPPGSVAYWPVRQAFCLYYGPPQEEAATVTLFARVTENLEGLRRVGEQVRLRQGLRILAEPIVLPIFSQEHP